MIKDYEKEIEELNEILGRDLKHEFDQNTEKTFMKQQTEINKQKMKSELRRSKDRNDDLKTQND